MGCLAKVRPSTSLISPRLAKPEGKQLHSFLQSWNDEENKGTSLVVQWLRLQASNTGGMGLIPGWGTKIPHALVWPKKNKNKASPIYWLLCPQKDRPRWERRGASHSLWRNVALASPQIPVMGGRTPTSWEGEHHCPHRTTCWRPGQPLQLLHTW